MLHYTILYYRDMLCYTTVFASNRIRLARTFVEQSEETHVLVAVAGVGKEVERGNGSGIQLHKLENNRNV